MTPWDLFFYVLAAVAGLIAAPFALVLAAVFVGLIVLLIAVAWIWLFERFRK